MELGLSQKEAVDFVTNVLGLSSPLSRLSENRVLFLNELVKAFHCSVPFQNVTVVLKRRVPTWDEIKASIMAGRGGLCYTVNVFMRYLLEALQYDVCFASCSIFFPDNHIATIVKNLTSPGSKHLVDFFGYPTFEAIPLDFEVESPIYYHSFLEYKFIREGGRVLRLHRKGEHRPIVPGKEYNVDGWRRVSEIDLTPRDLSYFHQSMNQAATLTPFNASFRTVIFRDLKLISIKDNLLMLENDERQLVVTKLETCEDMIETVRKYFPMLTVEQISKAIETIGVFKNSVSSDNP